MKPRSLPPPGPRYLEGGAREQPHTLPSPGSEPSPRPHSHSSTCSELSQVPPHFPHASARSQHPGFGSGTMESPSWRDRSSPSHPSSSPARLPGKCYSRLHLAHVSQASHVKHPCRVSDLWGDHATCGQMSAYLLLRKDTANGGNTSWQRCLHCSITYQEERGGSARVVKAAQ